MTQAEFTARYSHQPVSYDPTKGHPTGSSMFYECLTCHDVFPSMPSDSVMCSCRNFYIDVDYGRLGGRGGDSSFRLLSATPRGGT